MNLEEEYDILIFYRSARGIELTEEGKEFIYYAKNAMSSINAIDTLFRKKDPNVKGRAVLSLVSHHFDFLYEAVAAVYRDVHHIPLHFNIAVASRNAIIQSVLDSSVTMGLTIRAQRDSKVFKSLFAQSLSWMRTAFSGSVASLSVLGEQASP